MSLVAAYAVFTVNYLLYAVFLTDFLVVLLALLGLPPDPTALARLIGTGIGTGLAILAYLLWPTWEGTSAAEKFARLITAQGSYGRALLRAYTRPGRCRGGPARLAAAGRPPRPDRRGGVGGPAGRRARARADEREHGPGAGVGRPPDRAGPDHSRRRRRGSPCHQDHARATRACSRDLDELATGVLEATDQIAAALRQPAGS